MEHIGATPNKTPARKHDTLMGHIGSYRIRIPVAGFLIKNCNPM
jgi:hypothetical protein